MLGDGTELEGGKLGEQLFRFYRYGPILKFFTSLKLITKGPPLQMPATKGFGPWSAKQALSG